MFYIGVNQAVNPVKAGDALSGNSIFAIVCVYLFVVFYSFGKSRDVLAGRTRANGSKGWGPTPFVLSSECAPNHLRSLVMAAALMTQWLFNFVSLCSTSDESRLLMVSQVIAKITPIMLDDITYGTFLLFGSCCIIMGIYTIFCVPETKNVPLESIHLLFEGNIISGCVKDTVPRFSRAKELQHHHHHHVSSDDASESSGPVQKKAMAGVEHVEDA